MLEVNIKKSFKKSLNGFSLDVSFKSGAPLMGILGASGSGKSMTLKAIAGIVTPDSGRIVLGERVLFDSAAKTDLKPQLRRAGYLFQDCALFPNMTVRENIACAAKHSGADVLSAAETLRITDLLDMRPGTLSGGQRQRAALARCIAAAPDIFLLDEPFSALDAYLREELQIELKNLLAALKKPAVLVTHDRDEAYRLCDELAIMDNGRIIEHGKTHEIFSSPKKRVTARVTGCKNIFRAVKSSGAIYVPELDLYVPYSYFSVPEYAFAIPDDNLYIGIRAHDTVLCEKRDSVCIPVKLAAVSEAPFEWNMVFSVPSGGVIMHKADKTVSPSMPPIPEYLTFIPGRVMLLEAE